MITGSLSRRLLAQQPRVLSQRPIAKIISRPLSYTYQLQAAKDTQDKDSLKPEPYEYSKSGSDDQAARVEDTAFNPNKTTPEEQHDSAGRESGDATNPLNVSPANQEVSKPRSPTEGGAEGSAAAASDSPSDRSRSSGKGSPTKGSEGQKYSS
ncbi:hypothetical protein E4T42_02591 [Aureobasidium subglaciale]|uniref:Uncharacterized protein n=1 Tax=Aureobasidium subglaciale (strain EXF-2481) TaxID=1043005 RepID=A0A074YKU9_AURSE|nr:uncharacterized protein AUEXF2481DRAFT_36959 [Aureobasidium subglaciale EXF-2481]KAI5212018.1 hypothetical protein E4T38_00910 [Aureobasidium subglaciale]KAI5230737.1 hypothetical protein E4T40_00911 [Aureobasidium subglaciale]KAI5233772.1 hypothetical protein E4T41_00909 [Aureobasidium subglaciale]KAI5253959.1 hypothetical protein E4T42_02591 [Aureobasidium subglaciale]KAI5267275.1 hypothetical protein E4T46_00909 [Aureobasidium subglaciale]